MGDRFLHGTQRGIVVLLASFILFAGLSAMGQSPVGFWRFDDGSTNAAVDSSGNGYTAVLGNGVSWKPGRVGSAVSANGSLKQYVKIPAIDLSKTRQVTISFWSKRQYSTSGGRVLFESANFSSSVAGIGMYPDNPTCGSMQIVLNGPAGTTSNCYSAPSSGVWHHLAVVYDKTKSAGAQVALFVDGVQQNATRSLSAATNTNQFAKDPIYFFSSGGGTSSFDTGMVDDLRIYPSALSTSQIAQIYSSTKSQIWEDVLVSADAYGTLTTPSFTTSVNNELLVAFVAYDGPSGTSQTATVSGGGVTWTRRARSNTQYGTAEVWSAVAPAAPFKAQVTSAPGNGNNWHGSLTVVGFANASGVGRVATKGATSGAPDASIANVPIGNWVFAVGNDWDNPIARTPVSGQLLVHQDVDTQVGDTYWVQSTGAPSTVAGTVDIHDNAPTSDQWNYAAVEIVASGNTNPTGTLAAAPASINFGNVNVGSSTSQTVNITNTGSGTVSISGVSISGGGFAQSAVSTPLTLASGASTSFTVTFAPTATGSASGSVVVTSNATNPSLSIPLSGTGTSVTNGAITASPTSLSFGNVNVNSSSSLSVTLTNTGTTAISVSGVSIAGSGFSLTSVATPFSMAAGGTKTITVNFAPTIAGSASGNVVVTSNASNPTLTIPLSGTGVSTVTHQVSLAWNASTSQVSGYKTYRATNANGPFSVINSGLITALNYVDTAVVSGTTYYYYTTAVDSNSVESSPSNQASATIP